MRCYCCEANTALVRRVRLRPWLVFDPERGGPDSSAYQFYQKEMTYRWAIVCLRCYSELDNDFGLAEIGSKHFNIASQSRFDRAAILDEAKYEEWQRREAAKLGIS